MPAQAQQGGFEAQGEQHAPEHLQPDHDAELPGIQDGRRKLPGRPQSPVSVSTRLVSGSSWKTARPSA
ncbi:hypothetical protein [Pseudomonas asiatica]|uniref:hypothetical protein n=1 Tax=Pseudomonas asiatica TaxID=2219225 RepID=UPI0037CABBB3